MRRAPASYLLVVDERVEPEDEDDADERAVDAVDHLRQDERKDQHEGEHTEEVVDALIGHWMQTGCEAALLH